MRSPNMIVLGGISYAKSTLIKTYLYRQHVFGRQAWVIDVKGEYGPLARALGRTADRARAGRRGAAQPDRAPRRARGPAGPAARGRPGRAAPRPRPRGGRRAAGGARPGERGGGDGRADPADGRRRAAPSARGDGRRASRRPSAGEFAAANREAALALQRLCEGDLRGMFDGPTSEGIDLDAPLVVLDLSAMRDSEALGILMTCAAAWQQAILRERKRESEASGEPMAKVFCVFEEVWRVASNIGVAEWLQANFKLCRALGIANVALPPQADRLRHRRRRGLARRRGSPQGARRRRRLHRHLPPVARPAAGPARGPRPLRHRGRAGDEPRDRRGDLGDRLPLGAGPAAALGGRAGDHLDRRADGATLR